MRVRTSKYAVFYHNHSNPISANLALFNNNEYKIIKKLYTFYFFIFGTKNIHNKFIDICNDNVEINLIKVLNLIPFHTIFMKVNLLIFFFGSEKRNVHENL